MNGNDIRIKTLKEQISSMLYALKSNDNFLDKKPYLQIRNYFPSLVTFIQNDDIRIFTVENSDLDFQKYDNYEIDIRYLTKCTSYLFNNKKLCPIGAVLHLVNFKNQNWTTLTLTYTRYIRVDFFKINFLTCGVSDNDSELKKINEKIQRNYLFIISINPN